MKLNKVKKPGSVIVRSNFDDRVMYVGRRIRVATIKAKALGTPIPFRQMSLPGVLVVTGDKPGVLLRPVMWDGKDVYCRLNVFGSLQALNSSGNPKFKAEILTVQQLLKRARAFNKAVIVTTEDNKERTYVLLNSIGDLYVGAIRFVKGAFTAVTLEPVAAYNKKCPTRFKTYKDASASVASLLG